MILVAAGSVPETRAVPGACRSLQGEERRSNYELASNR